MDPNIVSNQPEQPVVPIEPAQQPQPGLQQDIRPVDQQVTVVEHVPSKNNRNIMIALVVVALLVGVFAWIGYWQDQQRNAILNNSVASSHASSARQVAEIYNADNGYYPATTEIFYSSDLITTLPTGIILVPGTEKTPLSSSNGKDHITWSCLDACTETKGGKITFWDFKTNAVSTQVIYVGDADESSVFVAPEQ